MDVLIRVRECYGSDKNSLRISNSTYVSSLTESVIVEDPKEKEEGRNKEESQEKVLQTDQIRRSQATPGSTERKGGTVW